MNQDDQEPNVTNRLQAQVALAFLNMLDPSSLSNGPPAFQGFPFGPIKLCPAV